MSLLCAERERSYVTAGWPFYMSLGTARAPLLSAASRKQPAAFSFRSRGSGCLVLSSSIFWGLLKLKCFILLNLSINIKIITLNVNSRTRRVWVHTAIFAWTTSSWIAATSSLAGSRPPPVPRGRVAAPSDLNFENFGLFHAQSPGDAGCGV